MKVKKSQQTCAPQQPHRLQSYDPSGFTTAVSVPNYRAQRYSAMIVPWPVLVPLRAPKKSAAVPTCWVRLAEGPDKHILAIWEGDYN